MLVSAEAGREGVDYGALADVGVADYADGDGALELSGAGVRLQCFQ